MTKAFTIARVFTYAVCAIAAAFAPNVPGTIALLHPTHPSTDLSEMLDPAAASLGWLGSAVASAFARAGFAGLAFATALAVTITFALVEMRACRIAAPPFAIAAVVLCAACSLDAVHVGAGASDGLFLAGLMLALERGGIASVVATALVTALWSNASPAGILAPLFAFAYAFGAAIEMRSAPKDAPDRTHRTRASLALAAVALAATCATPALLAYPLDALHALALDGGLNDLLPATPNVVAPLPYKLGVFLTIVAALAIGARSTSVGATCAFVVAAILSLGKGAFVPFVAIVGAPIVADAASRAYARGRTAFTISMRRAPVVELGVLAIVASLAAGLDAAHRMPTLDTALDVAPFGALAKYARDASPHRALACTKLPWCDVAERRYGLTVLADTRIGNAPQGVIADQRTISSASKAWVAVAGKRGVDAIFLDRRSGLVTVLAARGWRPFATDGSGTLLVRARTTP